jgi:serine/threonine protein kinase
MPEQHPPEKSIFLAAIEIGSAAERARFLDTACAGNRLLRAEVEALLDAHERPQPLVDAPLPDLVATADGPISEGPGTIIGPYKLMEQIGEGGMGLVFVAEQQQPIRRKVALKVIKPGMDTRAVIARFEAERQALALMDHPNIAKVLDAGETSSSRPFFVMDLVKGLPITEYCDQNRLSVRDRLELFVHLCQAVQHAHQKGIIHRDLILFLGFLLLGTLRTLGLLGWRLEQLEATTPRRLGRDGLKPGKRAPEFTLTSAAGRQVSLHDFGDRKVLLVFTQSGCGPCRTVIPELNRLERGDTQVLVVNNGDLQTTRKWSAEVGARFPVLAQDGFSISRKYEVFATPFAFLIDDKGVIASKGIINNRQQIRYVLSGTRVPGSNGHFAAEPDDSAEGESAAKPSLSPSEEVSHV